MTVPEPSPYPESVLPSGDINTIVQVVGEQSVDNQHSGSLHVKCLMKVEDSQVEEKQGRVTALINGPVVAGAVLQTPL